MKVQQGSGCGCLLIQEGAGVGNGQTLWKMRGQAMIMWSKDEYKSKGSNNKLLLQRVLYIQPCITSL